MSRILPTLPGRLLPALLLALLLAPASGFAQPQPAEGSSDQPGSFPVSGQALAQPQDALADQTPQVSGAEATNGVQPEVPPAPPPEPIMRDLPQPPAGKGIEAWYYEAKKLEIGGQLDPETSAYVEFLYRLVFSFGPEAEAKEAGRALVQEAAASGSQDRVFSLAASWLAAFGPDWTMYALQAGAGLALGNWQAVLDLAQAMRKNLPSTAKTKSNELAFYEYSAKAGLGDRTWVPQALGLLKSPSLDAWGAKILRLAAAGDLDPIQAELALMRADFQDKQYPSASVHAANARSVLLAPGVARQLLSEAARSFLSAGDYTGGLAFLGTCFPEAFAAENDQAPKPLASADRMVAVFSSGNADERLWVAAYYLARLWQGEGEVDAAAVLFLALTDSAPTAADADGALWYWLDLTLKRIAALDLGDFGSDPVLASVQVTDSSAAGSSASKRPFEMGALLEASQRWKNPAAFDDLVDGYDRSLLKAKAWNDALSLLTLIGPRLSYSTRNRFLYLDGRLVELGLATTSPEDRGGETDKAFSRDAYARILADPHVEEYYRTMSAWRLGLQPPFLLDLPDLSGAKDPAAQQPTSGATPQAVPLVDDYLSFDLDDLAGTQALKYLGASDKNLVAGLAFKLSAQGQHYPALRLARDAVNRGMGAQYPELYGLVYPRAWPEIVAEGAAIPGIPEALAYAIIRSESVFDPGSVSYAGARGLTQLMPSTAAETAKGLKMDNFSITDPRDNVRIGMTYYSYMLDRFGGKPIRAMFAYNAGPGRMAVWNKESGELPDDVLLETLNLAQPRQYAKNIVQAALAYGKVHYSLDALSLLDYLVEAKPLPVPVASQASVPAQAGQEQATTQTEQTSQSPETSQDSTSSPEAGASSSPAEGGGQTTESSGVTK